MFYCFNFKMPAQLIANAITNAPQVVLGSMPKNDVLRRGIARTRIIVAAAPPNPANTIELVIPENYQLYNGNVFFSQIPDLAVEEL